MPKSKNQTIICAHNALTKKLSPSLVDIIESTDLPIKHFCKSRYKLIRTLLKKYGLTPLEYRKSYQEIYYSQEKLVPKKDSLRGKHKYGSSMDKYIIERFDRSNRNLYLNDEH